MLCDKCHQDNAVVHIHIVDDHGGERDLHYCIPCVLQELRQESLPEELREYLDGVLKRYQALPGPIPQVLRDLMEKFLRFFENPPPNALTLDDNNEEEKDGDETKNPWGSPKEKSPDTQSPEDDDNWVPKVFNAVRDRSELDAAMGRELRQNLEKNGIDMDAVLSRGKSPRCPACHALDLGHEEHCGFCISFRRSELLQKLLDMDPIPSLEKHKGFFAATQNPVWLLNEQDDYNIPPKNRDKFLKCHAEVKRLPELLDRYLEARSKKRPDAAQMLKDEIQGIRQMLKEEMCRHPAVGSTAVVRKGLLPFRGLPPYPALPPESLFLAGFLAQNALDTPQVVQGFQIQANRTAVDFLQSPNMSATEVRNALSALLAKDPLFEDGAREDRTAALFSANGRAMAYIGTQDTIAPRTDGAFSLLLRGTEDEAPMLLRTLCDTLGRLTTRIPFFVDTHLGYYHPMPDQMGSAVTLSCALHLPALIRTQGTKNIQGILPLLEQWAASRGKECLRLTPMAPNGAGGLAPCGMFLLQDTRSADLSLFARLALLQKVAHALERAELRARKWMLHSPDFRENALEGFRRAWGVFENGRQTQPEEAFCLLDTLLFGKELGCFPSLDKQRLLDALRLTLCRCTNPAATLRVDTTPLTEEIVWNYARQNRTLPPQENMPDLLWEEQCRGALSLERPESVRPTPQMPESPDDQDQHIFPNPTPAQDFRGEGPARERAQQASLYRHNLMADLQRLLGIPKQGKG